jgi:uncharacterized membrane protein
MAIIRHRRDDGHMLRLCCEVVGNNFIVLLFGSVFVMLSTVPTKWYSQYVVPVSFLETEYNHNYHNPSHHLERKKSLKIALYTQNMLSMIRRRSKNGDRIYSTVIVHLVALQTKLRFAHSLAEGTAVLFSSVV